MLLVATLLQILINCIIKKKIEEILNSSKDIVKQSALYIFMKILHEADNSILTIGTRLSSMYSTALLWRHDATISNLFSPSIQQLNSLEILIPALGCNIYDITTTRNDPDNENTTQDIILGHRNLVQKSSVVRVSSDQFDEKMMFRIQEDAIKNSN